MTEQPISDAPPGKSPVDAVRGAQELHLADSVAAAVLLVPGVSRLHPGMFGEVATYLPHRRVIGVQIRDDITAIHVVLDWGYDIADATDRIRSATAPLVGTPVDITVQDLAEPTDSI